MESLIKSLTEATEGLKVYFIAQTEVWAAEEVERNIERRNNWNSNNGGFVCPSNEYWKEEKWFWNTPNWKFEKTEMIARSKKAAIDHYNNSIIKLALRIQKKGLDINNLKMTSGYVDVNLEMTLTDGIKTVRAWTIIAEGIVQRPHYRYLIK